MTLPEDLSRENEIKAEQSVESSSNETIISKEKDLNDKSQEQINQSLDIKGPEQQSSNKILNQNILEGLNKESFFEYALKELKDKRINLENEIKELEIRKVQIEKDSNNSFAGKSDSIARQVKGFQDYLTGAMQGLTNSVEQLDLISQPLVVAPSPLDKNKESEEKEVVQNVLAISDTFKPDKELILKCLDQYLGQPDYYADPWKFRRSLEPKDVEILEDWFFNMGGRGAQQSRGTRSRNILLSAALIAILGEIYGDRFQALILASQPERLGEWRRGLQDALGLNREDFGPNSGIVLFERSEALVECADRLEAREEVPLILIDAAERKVEIPILQFPIWLAFAANPEELYIDEELI
ncbi:DUF3086 domain-containing protein [Prochlorococcus marinus]|uniref:DUF3086 domain-containing protein n=1 Tax=Prochlorococcus marinus TaxID=1219 RepID=UPI0022B512D0|nr:DUF3086 domain-containing protein [Prochlorococcus marinus]